MRKKVKNPPMPKKQKKFYILVVSKPENYDLTLKTAKKFRFISVERRP